MPSAAWADQQEADYYETLGEEAYLAGDYEHAFHYFEQAHRADSTRTWTLHRMALCANHLGQYKKAEGLLRRVISRGDARPDAHFDLGLALYFQKRFREALVQFDIAQARQVQINTLDYYRGACLFRLGQYERARELCLRAYESLPAQRVQLGYYLGASELALGNSASALAYLEEAYVQAEPGIWRERIGRLLVRAREEKRRARWWALSFNLGGAYDSNVFYEPEEFEVADRAGFYGYGRADIAVYPLRGEFGFAGLGYRLYQNLHLDTSEQIMDDYDLTRHGLRLEAMGRLVSGRVPVYLGGEYEWSKALLAGEDYQVTDTLYPHLTVEESRWLATRLAGTLQAKRFDRDQERDAFYSSPAIMQIFSFWDDTAGVLIEASYEHNEAESDEYDYRGFGGFVSSELPLVGNLYLLTGLRGRYLEYLNSVEKRIDRKYVVDAALRYQLLTWMQITGGYCFQNNVSLEEYQYEKHVFMFDLGFAF